MCFASDEDDRMALWVKPCRCRGTTKWVNMPLNGFSTNLENVDVKNATYSGRLSHPMHGPMAK